MPTARARVFRVVAALTAGGAALLLAWSFRARPSAAVPPPTATPEPIDLATTTRFISPHLRLEADAIELAVTRDGRVWFEGEALEDGAGERLKELLVAEADRRREDRRWRPSARALAVRADAGAPWGAVRPLVLGPGDPDVRIERLRFVVRPACRDGAAPLQVPIRQRGIVMLDDTELFHPVPVRLTRREGATRILVLAETEGPRWIDLGREGDGFARLRRLLRRVYLVKPETYIPFAAGDDIPFADVLRVLDLATPFDLGVRFMPRLRDDPNRLGGGMLPFEMILDAPPWEPQLVPLLPPPLEPEPFPDSDDVHAIFLLLIGFAFLVTLALSAGRPAGFWWIIGLKVPVTFIVVVSVRSFGSNPGGSAVTQWAVPCLLGGLIWIFARPRRIRLVQPFALFLLAVLFTEQHADLARRERFTADPVRLVDDMAATLGREKRLWQAAEWIKAEGPESFPAGPAGDAEGPPGWPPRYLRDACLADVKAEERWHTFFTGIHRVVPACPDLEIRSPGGSREGVLDRLEFRRHGGGGSE